MQIKYEKRVMMALVASLLCQSASAEEDALSVLQAKIMAQQAQLTELLAELQHLKAQQTDQSVTIQAKVPTPVEQSSPSKEMVKRLPTASSVSASTQTTLPSKEQRSEMTPVLSPVAPVKHTAANPFSGASMNPDVSFIVDTSLVSRQLSDVRFGQLRLPGFTHAFAQAHDGHEHGMSNMNNGFNLNYGELVLASTVDPYFDLFTAIHASDSGAELEEAYMTTRQLPANMQLKLGKFLSAFGRLNSQHHHYWDFSDQPLIYQGIFGGHGLLEKGVQISWLAPTRQYLQLGAEWLQGENEQSFGTEAIASTSKGAVDGAGVAVGFIKTSVDWGNSSWLAGLSYAHGQYRHADGDHAKAGDMSIWGVDLTGKYFLDASRYVMWQSEYLQRHLTDAIQVSYDDQGSLLAVQALTQHQSGYYSQLIWKFDPQWRVGYRYDAIDQNQIRQVNGLLGQRQSVMLEYNPTEFSRIRLQYARNEAFADAQGIQPFDEWVLQFNMAIGAHGAHTF